MDARIEELIAQAKTKNLTLIGYKEQKEVEDEVTHVIYIVEFKDAR
jgi:hypothetical protein